MPDALEKLDRIIADFVERGTFRPVETDLDLKSTRMLVKFNGNPIRFLPKMFEDEWELVGVHPDPGTVRVLRVVIDEQATPRLIVRQGPGLYVYTGVPVEQ